MKKKKRQRKGQQVRAQKVPRGIALRVPGMNDPFSDLIVVDMPLPTQRGKKYEKNRA